jgi:photosystem II stability/assembly factor-like uncharacterized protein
MIKKALTALIIILIALSGSFGCSRKGKFAPWITYHWEKIKGGYIDAIVIDAENSDLVYVVDVCKTKELGLQPNQVWKSEDGGNHWKEDPTKKFEDIYRIYRLSLYGESGIFVDPLNPKIVLKEAISPLQFNERSEDGGKSWEKILRGTLIVPKNPAIVYCVSNEGSIFFSLDFGKTWKRSPLPPISYIPSENTFAIAVDPKDPNVLYVGSPSGLFKSVEGNGNYEYYPVSDSVDTSYIYIDPKNPNSLYAVSHNENFFATFKSYDCGKTWEKMGDFYFNPLFPGILMKVVKTKTTPPLLNLYVSLDNGKNWKLTDLDLDENGIYSITTGNDNAIYAETWHGLFKSVDKGLHWSQITNFQENYWQATEGNSCFNSRFLVDPDDPDRIYWAGEFLKSDDGGKTWQKMNFQCSKRIHGSAIAIDPYNHDIVYLGTTGTEDVEPLTPEQFSEQGIYRSDGDGKSWVKLGLNGCRISAIAVSPTTGIVYAGTFYNGLFMSKNSGKSWERIDLDSDPYISISSLTIDSKNGIVYVGVLGGGIFKVEDKN